MPTLVVVNFNIICATLGGFITIFGLVSYLLKEKFYLSEALISTIFGVIFGPHAADFIRPLDYANGSEIDLETITLYFTRLVLGVQLVLAGVQLPSKYLWKEWKSLSILLGPGMCIMWMSTSLLVWGLVPDISFLFALAVGAAVTPTDPILSNSIVKGKFADKNIPRELQKIIIAESGANDGLGYPFLFLALYLIQYTGDQGLGTAGGGAGKAIGLWFIETWCYTILLSIAYGAVVGWLAKELLHWAEERHYVDRESFLVFAITLALFIVGTCGMIGSDDVLACFIAGNVFTWDDWFRLETKDDSLQPTIDLLLNLSVFLWFGAVCPWHLFVENTVIPIYRLIPLGILVLLLRRLPMVLCFHHFIHQVEDIRHALFVGFFGPIGVSAIFYLYIAREFLHTLEVDGHQREDAAQLSEVLMVVIWFLTICSIVVHGLSIPLGKFGLYLPRTISMALSFENRSTSWSRTRSSEDRHTRSEIDNNRQERVLGSVFRRRRPATEADTTSSRTGLVPGTVSRIGRYIFSDIRRPHGATVHGADGIRGEVDETDDNKSQPGGDSPPRGRPTISAPTDGRVMGHAIARQDAVDNGPDCPPRPSAISASNSAVPSRVQSPAAARGEGTTGMPAGWQRSIRFGDEVAAGGSVAKTGNEQVLDIR
ncbi:hypothetical protein B0A48_15326 [Cryoendolithus antarcticus]|uniref:Cation/H+ exchanger transmembrane domain-containing protein n=1 Tax=Cryoendolithus antarcticus TaxID=1507870 RepID=A0A1V8SI71_9PEZI|nr:hypothetical protein B0A48_15326 [Cryoendolithus antarcticus]